MTGWQTILAGPLKMYPHEFYLGITLIQLGVHCQICTKEPTIKVSSGGKYISVIIIYLFEPNGTQGNRVLSSSSPGVWKAPCQNVVSNRSDSPLRQKWDITDIATADDAFHSLTWHTQKRKREKIWGSAEKLTKGVVSLTINLGGCRFAWRGSSVKTKQDTWCWVCFSTLWRQDTLRIVQ